MNDTVGGGACAAAAASRPDVAGPGGRHGAALHAIAQLLAVQEFGHEIRASTVDSDVVDRDEIRMGECTQARASCSNRRRRSALVA